MSLYYFGSLSFKFIGRSLKLLLRGVFHLGHIFCSASMSFFCAIKTQNPHRSPISVQWPTDELIIICPVHHVLRLINSLIGYDWLDWILCEGETNVCSLHIECTASFSKTAQLSVSHCGASFAEPSKTRAFCQKQCLCVAFVQICCRINSWTVE